MTQEQKHTIEAVNLRCAVCREPLKRYRIDAGAIVLCVACEKDAKHESLVAQNKELLAALRWICELIADRPDDMYGLEGEPTEELNTWLMVARAAIEKAKGQEAEVTP